MGEETQNTEVAKVQRAPVESNGGALAPPELLSKAVESGAGVEVMERLMELQERWEKNQARKAFDAAMAAIRSDLPRVRKNAEVDFTSSKGRTHYKYERLQDVVEAIQPVLSEHGLSFRWRTDSSGKDVSVTCIISHELGHSEETTLSAPLDRTGNKNAIQSIGSTVTYLQRYTLKAALGIAAAEDDDGQAAAPRPSEPRKQKRPPDPEPEPASDAQLKKMHATAIEYYGSSDIWDSKRPEIVESITKGRTDSSADLTRAECHRIIEGLEHKIEQAEAEQGEYPDDDVRDDEIPTGEEE